MEVVMGALRRWAILIVGLVFLLGGLVLGTTLYPPGGAALTTQTAASERPTSEPQRTQSAPASHDGRSNQVRLAGESRTSVGPAVKASLGRS